MSNTPPDNGKGSWKQVLDAIWDNGGRLVAGALILLGAARWTWTVDQRFKDTNELIEDFGKESNEKLGRIDESLSHIRNEIVGLDTMNLRRNVALNWLELVRVAWRGYFAELRALNPDMKWPDAKPDQLFPPFPPR